MEPNALQGVAQLHSLRKLTLDGCAGLSAEMLRAFFETTPHGSALSVAVHRCRGLVDEAAQAVHEGVVRSRGGRDTPRWVDALTHLYGDEQ
jgi:hypothetical protein